jgi:hypothetical protein
VIWRTTVQGLKFKPAEGLEVIATGRITSYPGKSSYQIVIDALEPAGIGALMALLEERKRSSPPRACSTSSARTLAAPAARGRHNPRRRPAR